ncbi:ABC transporter ATP-binding protein [Propionispora hippei]|uniref:Lipooligosaccharide transport system ATP-binding protein n=1 Tax=Propionispora hippei DSM 15287 TaxID=1123003 RepID=A0A1M6HWL9_9FIRM|nr:ABC transporter ATP-binding protein [Propionispora hippei]SHJ26632.1 lipooligosaccharide transport system ATP-binding protein [Propionispora hippei DSM 15287]
MSCIVQAENLGKTYSGFKALKGISFTIEERQCVGFLGHNGAGKSTTMRMLYGLSTVEEGSLRLFGQPVAPLTPPALKALLGIVPQEDNLDVELTVLENLEIYGGYFGLSRQEARQRGLELLRFMGLEDKMKATVEALSGGSKRKLVIARALLNRPKMIILDEPTTGLDPQARRQVWQKLRQLKAEGATLVLTTHYMEEAAQLCDRLLVMNEGLILAEGSPEELVKRYVRPYVIEVRVPSDQVPADFAGQVARLGGEAVYLADDLFVFCEDGDRLWRELASLGVPQHACYLRSSHLEDVFLKLTGRRGEA